MADKIYLTVFLLSFFLMLLFGYLEATQFSPYTKNFELYNKLVKFFVALTVFLFIVGLICLVWIN